MQLIPTLLATAAFALSFTASAQEAAIRKTLAERIPQMEKIDEVRTRYCGIFLPSRGSGWGRERCRW